MNSRLDKYYENNDEVVSSRVHKNEELYKEISKSEIDGYEVKSNATVLGENKNEIDVDKIKKILDNKYNEIPKRKSIRLEDTEEEKEEEETTKEYDINVVLEKAREQKSENYEEERLKKLRDTQFDILKNLDIEKTKKENEQDELDDLEEDNLKSLINTIALNEKNNATNTSLDILSDLKGSGNTEVLTGLKEEIEKKEEEETEELNKTNTSTTNLVNSFYTSSNAIKKKDFEDIDEDFSKDMESSNVFIKVVIGIIILVFIAGVVLLIKTIYFS